MTKNDVLPHVGHEVFVTVPSQNRTRYAVSILSATDAGFWYRDSGFPEEPHVRDVFVTYDKVASFIPMSPGEEGGAIVPSKATKAGLNLDFLQSPWFWMAVVFALGLHYFTRGKGKARKKERGS